MQICVTKIKIHIRPYGCADKRLDAVRAARPPSCEYLKVCGLFSIMSVNTLLKYVAPNLIRLSKTGCSNPVSRPVFFSGLSAGRRNYRRKFKDTGCSKPRADAAEQLCLRPRRNGRCMGGVVKMRAEQLVIVVTTAQCQE